MMLIAALISVEVACVSLLVLLRQGRARWHRGNVFELDVAEDAPLDLEAWRSFFRNLYGMTPPAWKRALLGVPHMTFEIWAAEGELSARCWCPDRLQGLARVSLRTAAPGLEMSECADATQTFGPKAARARVQLWRESISPAGRAGRRRPSWRVGGARGGADRGVANLNQS